MSSRLRDAHGVVPVVRGLADVARVRPDDPLVLLHPREQPLELRLVHAAAGPVQRVRLRPTATVAHAEFNADDDQEEEADGSDDDDDDEPEREVEAPQVAVLLAEILAPICRDKIILIRQVVSIYTVFIATVIGPV